MFNEEMQSNLVAYEKIREELEKITLGKLLYYTTGN